MVIISENSSIAEGETGLLACVGSGVPTVNITWMRNGQVILNLISPQISISDEHAFLVGTVFTQSFLQICGVSMEDAGDYTCVVSNGQHSASSTTQLAVTSG